MAADALQNTIGCFKNTKYHDSPGNLGLFSIRSQEKHNIFLLFSSRTAGLKILSCNPADIRQKEHGSS